LAAVLRIRKGSRGGGQSKRHTTSSLDQQMQVIQRLVKFARKPAREKLQSVQYHLAQADWYWKLHGSGGDKTAYIIGLFGTGRWYVTELVRQHIGERAKYFRFGIIRSHRVPTSIIYGGHATIKYVSRAQALPALTNRILETVRGGIADLIFVYRHPVDSLLTNWVLWRNYIREINTNATISRVYKNTEQLCVDLDQNFSEFKAFAEGDPAFFAGAPAKPLDIEDQTVPQSSRFLSFNEFVEETELFFQSATLVLRLEDFMIDPLKEFSKILTLMSVALDSSLRLSPPESKAYRYLSVREKVPRFGDFLDGLDAETRSRMERIGYSIG
jgi:hypothetical protein